MIKALINIVKKVVMFLIRVLLSPVVMIAVLLHWLCSNLTSIQIINIFVSETYKQLIGFTEWLERRRHFGLLRFWLIRFIYSITPRFPKTRNKRWDFVLAQLPILNSVYFSGLRVLDVGCGNSLLLYEIARRKYQAIGIDIDDYGSRFPKHIKFHKCDILKEVKPELRLEAGGGFDYIIATSVIELVGIDKYGDGVVEGADRIAIKNIHSLLASHGYFILTLPVWNWAFVEGRKYTLGDILRLVRELFAVFSITQIEGQICMVLVKLVPTKQGYGLARFNP